MQQIERSSKVLYRMEVLKTERGQKKEIISKEHIIPSKVTLLRGNKGAYLADYLTIADQVISVLTLNK